MMSWTGGLFLFLLPFLSLGAPLEKPSRCLKNEKYPCAVWTSEKSLIPTSGPRIFVSADTLFEMHQDRIYLIRGKLWVVSDKTFTVQTRFGAVKSEGKGEIWSEASDSETVVRAFSNELSVIPRGGETKNLAAGFEIKLSYVNRETRSAEVYGPFLSGILPLIKDLHAVLESEDIFREKTAKLTAIVLSAAPIAAEETRQTIERELASAQAQQLRLKYEKEKNAGRDSYLRQLFIKKSNFED